MYTESLKCMKVVSLFIKKGGKKTFSDETLRRIKGNLDVE